MKKLITFTVCAFLGLTAMGQDASFPLELNGGYIDFNDDANLRDTWYVGGATGFNFTENAGLRGYYWRALDDGQISEWDNLEIYGVETTVKAPITESIKPYIVVGGGLFKPFGEYVPEDPTLGDVDDKFFGSAGAGLDLSFINFLSVTGYARAMVSEFDQLNTVDQGDNEISTSWNYGASINFRIGDKKNPFKVRQDERESNVPMPTPEEQKATMEKESEEQIESYEQDKRIQELEERIQKLEEKQQREEEMEKLRREIREELIREYDLESSKKKEDTEQPQQAQNNQSTAKSEIISRLEALNDQLDRLEEQQAQTTASTQEMISDLQQQQNENQQELEQRLQEARERRLALDESDPDYDEMRALIDENIELLERRQELSQRDYERELERLRDEIDDVEDEADEQEEDFEEAIEEERRRQLNREYLRSAQDDMSEEEYRAFIREVEIDDEDGFFDRLIYSHSDAFVGYGFGEDNYSAFLMGARPNFYFAGSRVFISPEVSVGVGSETTVNVLGNALFDLNLNNATVEPYLGLGAGFIAPDGDFKAAYNMIFGTELNAFADGKVNLEFAGRNLFKYNQLTIGYEVF